MEGRAVVNRATFFQPADKKTIELGFHLCTIAAEALKARPGHAFSAGLPLDAAVAGRGERR
jgi:hypothetical protein